MLLPLLYLLRSELVNRKLYATLLTGALAAGLLSISKVSAILAFMRFFPRVIADDYGQTYWQGIMGTVRQLTGFPLLVPFYYFTGRDVEEISLFFHRGAGEQFGIWEMNVALSPALLLLLTLGLGYLIFRISRTRLDSRNDRWIAILFLVLGIWLTMDMTLAQGWLYGVLKPLPIIRSLHVNVRFASAFVFPMALLGGFIFHEFFKGRAGASNIIFILLAILTIGMPALYLTLPDDVYDRTFNLNSALPTYAEIDGGATFPIQNVANITDMGTFHQQASNLDVQDPMFGYQGEYFAPKVLLGPALGIRDGYYNFTNPAGYVFPKENHLQPYDLFRADQTADLELFLQHKQPELAISGWQKFANGVNVAALVISIFVLFFELMKSKWKSFGAR
jgi:hypothetical protein